MMKPIAAVDDATWPEVGKWQSNGGRAKDKGWTESGNGLGRPARPANFENVLSKVQAFARLIGVSLRSLRPQEGNILLDIRPTYENSRT